jgi:hypothetical protein
MKPRPPPPSLTLEDLNIVLQLALRSKPRHDQVLVSFLRVVVAQDRRDADAMLIMVELHASRVVQVPTGDWCYFGHSSQSVFQNETLQ